MWHLGTQVSGGLGSAGLVVGLNDPKQFYGSRIIRALLCKNLHFLSKFFSEIFFSFIAASNQVCKVFIKHSQIKLSGCLTGGIHSLVLIFSINIRLTLIA